MARLKTEKTYAVADMNMLDPNNQALVQALMNQGWTCEQLKSDTPGNKNGSKYKIKNHPFVAFHRAIENPCFKGGGKTQIGRNTPFLPIGGFQQDPQTAQNQGISALNLTGSSSTMG